MALTEDFAKARPAWLRNEAGEKLELDGYSDRVGLAFEHQGRQHDPNEKFPLFSDEERAKIYRHDEIKRKVCAERGIRLVEIPEVGRGVSPEELPDLIARLCEAAGVRPVEGWRERLSAARFENTPKAELELAKIARAAADRGGVLLSSTWIGSGEKYRFKCASGHEFETRANSLMTRGNWCPYCAGNAKGQIDEMRALASDRGGECLSETYINSTTKLRWRCTEGHEWDAVPLSVKTQGTWCPRCAPNSPKGREPVEQIARERGGELLAKEYLGVDKKHLFRCQLGHYWKATPTNIKKGAWCPVCSGRYKTSPAGPEDA